MGTDDRCDLQDEALDDVGRAGQAGEERIRLFRRAYEGLGGRSVICSKD